jgi:hypothetical protein
MGKPRASRQIIVWNYCSGLCGEAGTTISFHPNSRASSEKAPGPRKAIATKIAVAWMVSNLESKKLPERDIPKTAMLKHSRLASRLRTGVRKPNKMKTPVAVSKTPAISIGIVGCGLEKRRMIP